MRGGTRGREEDAAVTWFVGYILRKGIIIKFDVNFFLRSNSIIITGI